MSFLRNKVQQESEETGVYGAGLDRARPIIKELNGLLPLSLEMLGKMKKANYGTGFIIIDFELSDNYNPLGLVLDYVYKNEDKAKEFIMTEIQAMPEKLRNIMNDIAKEDFSLSIEFTLSSGKQSAHVNLEPSEIEDALKRNTTIDSQTMSLMLIAKAENMLLPVKVDDFTNWV